MRDVDAFVALLSRHLKRHLDDCVADLTAGTIRDLGDYRDLSGRIAVLRQITQDAIPHAQRVYYGIEEEER